MAILNEVYVGRLPEIQQMITDIHNIREEVKRKGNFGMLKTTKIFEKHIEEMWGFKAFVFDIYISKIPNAITICAGSCIDCDLLSVIEYTNKGYRFCKSSNICATSKIATCILTDDSISDEEILAIMLHEIGHSFVERAIAVNDSMIEWRKSLLIQYLMQLIFSILTLNITNIITLSSYFPILFSNSRRIMAEVDKIKKNVPGMRQLNLGVETICNYISRALNRMYSRMFKPKSKEQEYAKLQKIKKRTEKTISKDNLDKNTALGRTNERLSDDFANMYGLGVPLANALFKISNPYKYIDENPDELSDIQKKIDDCRLEIIGMVDVHPGNCDRLMAMLEALQYDYKTLKVDKKIKDQMKRDIDALTKICNDIKKSSGPIKEYQNKYMSKSAAENIKKGNTETDSEKYFNDKEQIDNDWMKNKINI